MTEKRKKERKIEIQNFEYLENKKSFLDETKSIFHNHLRTVIDKKYEKVSTSFKVLIQMQFG